MNRDCTTTIRGIAILTIIIGHIGVSGFDLRAFNPFGGIGVAMFLFLSGYGLTESYKNNGLGGFWRKKNLKNSHTIPYIDSHISRCHAYIPIRITNTDTTHPKILVY